VWGLSAFAFDVAPLYAEATTLKIGANALDGRRHG
jgi:hypothetical protein